jgi:pyruvate dehydrogenase E2 component (dihydrolipoamide acetyltransferase)
MEEGTLAKWHVKVGDAVRSGDVIAEIETDKATMEVEAVDEGVVEALLVPEGTEAVKVNAPIARLGGGEGIPAAVAASPPAPVPPQSSAAPPTAPPRRGELDHAVPPSPPGGGGPRSGGRGAVVETATDAPTSDRIPASPLARRVARQRGLDLAAIAGSGPHGRVILRDVEAAVAAPATVASAPDSEAATAKASPAGAPTVAPGATPLPKSTPPAAEPPRQALTLEQMGIPAGSYDLKPLDGMRRTVARRLTDSFRDIPHFPLTIDLEIDALLATRTTVNAMLAAEGGKVSVNDMVIKAAAVALRRVPEANASFTPEGIALHRHADIAMAVAIDGGLITPIIRAAETKGLAQIAREAKDLAERARARKLKPDEFQGGTFSVSNLGMFGVKAFASIINPPQGAILSVGAGERRPVVRGDQLAIATVMTVTLTCDHRVVDGAIGARWLAAFKTLIENPIAMIV